MHFFQSIPWGRPFQHSIQSQSSESGRPARPSKLRSRPKHDGKMEPVVTALENRELIGSFIADVALAAGGIAAAERASDPFGEASWVDLSVSGGPGSGASPAVIDRGGTPGPVPQMGISAGSRPSESIGGGDDGLLGEPAASPRQAQATVNDNGEAVPPSVLTDALSDLTPRPHGAIRKLQLAPPASAVGASTTFVADTSTPASHGDAEVEIPSPNQPAPFTAPIPTAPPLLPPVQPPSIDGQSESSPSTGPALHESDASGTVSAEGGSSQPGSSESAAAGTGLWTAGTGSESFSTGTVASSALPNGGRPLGQNCWGGGRSGQSGVGQSGGGPPITPPGLCQSAAPDPMYVLDWNDGLVLFPGVTEYDFVAPGPMQDLRAQVYGCTVTSYQWDLSQAPAAQNVMGQGTYRLQFQWMSTGINRITVTALSSAGPCLSQTYTFSVNAAPPGNGTAGNWPTVVPPDWLSEPQSLLASDSPTRPYAVSLASGSLSVVHELPSYNPRVAPTRLIYNSLAAIPKPIFVTHYAIDPNRTDIPSTVSARLQFDGVWGPSVSYTTTAFNPGDVLQISLQADASGKVTGRYDYTVEVTANYSMGPPVVTTITGKVNIVNDSGNPHGAGWQLVIPQLPKPAYEMEGTWNAFGRLHILTDGVLLNQGAGNTVWFAGSGPNYPTPRGDFSVLVKNGDNTFTRTLKDGFKQNFDAQGRLTSIVDRNGNTIDETYTVKEGEASYALLSIRDSNGLITTFTYSGANVSSITDPSGRITTFTYAGSQLSSVRTPDGALWQHAYGPNGMSNMTDPRGNVTTFSYDGGSGRINQITRPDSTFEQYSAYQTAGLGGGTALLMAEAVAKYTDPRNFRWDWRPDWDGFGTTMQTTDPLGLTDPAGHMTVLHRDTNALVITFTDRLTRHTLFQYNDKGNPIKLTNPDQTIQTVGYNPFSEVVTHEDELSRLTMFHYDVAGNLTQLDPPLLSMRITMTYTTDGLLATLTNGRLFTTSFTYDAQDRMTQITYPDDDADATNNPKVTLTYDSASNLLTRTDERNNTTMYTYDSMDRVKTVTTPDRDGAGGLPAPVTTLTYDAVGNLTVLTEPDPDGSGSLTSPVTTLTYNSMNRVGSSVDALSNTTTFAYDNAGNLLAVSDPLSRTMTYTYNELGYRTSMRTPLGNINTLTHDAEGQLIGIRDPLNRITTFAYNNRGWMATAVDATSQTTTFSYDAVGNRTVVTRPDPDGSGPLTSPVITFTYDGVNRLIRLTDALNQDVQFGYDGTNNLTSVTDPLAHTTNYSYDARDRLTVVTQADPDGAGPLTSPVTSFVYDAAGNRTVVTDPLSRKTTFVYDPANRPTSITQPDPDGGGPLSTPITTFSYDNLDRLLSLKDPVNNLTTWTYDAIDQVLTEVDPLSKTVTYTYDAAGQLTRIVDRKLQRREFVYDNDGRRTQEKWCTTASGACTTSRIFTYTYDAADQLTDVNETDSRYTFTYDNMGRVTGIASLGSNMPSVTLSNVYDTIGRRTAVSDNLAPAGTLSFTYDAADRMTNAKMTVGGTVGPNVDFGYDAASRLTSLSRQVGTGMQNKVVTTLTYDNADRMTALTHTYVPTFGGSSTLATYTYGYNAASELTTESNQDGSFTYTYDNTSQLIGVDASGGTCGATGCDESFSYDVNGNRTMTGYTTGTGNRLTSDGTYNYTYDNNGNMLTKTRISDSQKTEYSWDFRNRLTQVVLKNSGGSVLQQTDFTYDAFDRRIIKSFDDDGPGPNAATVTKTIYDSAGFAANPYADFDGSNSLTMRYLFGPGVDMILARRNASGTVAWYLTDHLGTVRDLASTNGTVLDHISYSAYGNVTAESQPANGDRFKFTAREYDSELAQYYYRARHYDPAAGRFLSNDPMAFDAGDRNLYRYVLNTPTGHVDPTGLYYDGDIGAAVHRRMDEQAKENQARIDRIKKYEEGYKEALKTQLMKIANNQKIYEEAAKLIAEKYIAGVIDFLEKYKYARIKDSQGKRPLLTPASTWPVCADWCDYFSDYWDRVYKENRWLAQYYEYHEGQWHASTNKDTPQHNYVIFMMAGYRPPGLNYVNVNPKSSDPNILIFDPWLKIGPYAYGTDKHPNPPTNLGDVDVPPKKK